METETSIGVKSVNNQVQVINHSILLVGFSIRVKLWILNGNGNKINMADTNKKYKILMETETSISVKPVNNQVQVIILFYSFLHHVS